MEFRSIKRQLWVAQKRNAAIFPGAVGGVIHSCTAQKTEESCKS